MNRLTSCQVLNGGLITLLPCYCLINLPEEEAIIEEVVNVVTGLPKTGQVEVFRTGDDGDIQAGSDVSPRFVDNEDNTISDKVTGLMWIKDISLVPPFDAAIFWNDAIDACKNLDYAEHSDWRLPNYFELYSITNWDGTFPAIDETFFPDSNKGFMSSTTQKYWAAMYDDWAGVAFQAGTGMTRHKTDGSYYARPVRTCCKKTQGR